ncbi:MAG: PAS domain-containing protein, partial [Bacteroidales bacterium]|nr:PAS domain-containing protein [Bacteroidales bacterium]
IVLSGTGSDGTQGVKAVKEAGRVVLVQDETSAVYNGMPKSASATGVADYTLLPDKMPEQLISYFGFIRKSKPAKVDIVNIKFTDALPKILVLLRNKTGHDFSLYKPNTLHRRIERRMNVHQIEQISGYIQFLQKSETEASLLFKDLLIGVTSFFRDPEAFESLKHRILPEYLAGKADESMIRVWVTGCSTGEEVYSLAMIFEEVMQSMKRHFNLQFFGTDIDEDAIDFARIGLYPPGIQTEVSEERLKRYFVKEENGFFRIKKSVREKIIFAAQNVIKDPPFTKLDLLSCRNLLIYLTAELQKKLLPVFRFSLKPDGILFLGSSETIGTLQDLFATAERKWKIYQQIPDPLAQPSIVYFPTLTPMVPKKPETRKPTPPLKDEISELHIVETILQQSEIPSGVVIDETGQIHYIHGHTGKFLEPATGVPRLNIFDMARQGLKQAVAPALHEAAAELKEVAKRGIKVASNGDETMINLVVRPLIVPKLAVKLFLLLFETRGIGEKAKTAGTGRRQKEKSIEWMEQELNRTRHTLYTTIEELETSNEELKSTNEELQSTNEEMQSANEELETSREELQSMNEESVTINAELQCRIDELSKANDDMKNLLDSTDIAIIFLDKNLNIRRFTPRITDLIQLTMADIGRPVRHFASTLSKVDLELLSQEVLIDLATKEAEVESSGGHSYNLRIRPYRTMNNVIDGVVITLEKIVQMKSTQKGN